MHIGGMRVSRQLDPRQPNLSVTGDLLGTAASADHMRHCAGEQLASSPAGSRPRNSMFPGPVHLRRKGRKPSLFRGARWKLPPCDSRDDGARVCPDELKFIPALIDHEEDVTRYTDRRKLGRESTSAIRIHYICARVGLRDYVAV